jgi:hypothetical protein
MSAAVKAFVEEARGVTIEDAAERLGLVFKPRGSEHPQPCPAAGGDDRFSFNTSKNTWNCRGCGVGGRDAIGMAAHVLGFDVKSRDGLLEACSAVLGRDIPDEGERESEEGRAARLERLGEQKRKNAEAAAKREADQIDFREKERKKARGIYEAARPLWSSPLVHGREYLRRRSGGVLESEWLRVSAEVTYWHGQDERGQPASLYSGPAMVAPFLAAGGEIVGCHITWIDLDRGPKFRPQLYDPATGQVLPTKKMRGTKKGGVIPVFGDPASRRWLGGEGIENTVAFALAEGRRADTFYFAAGDLGNMAGPADPKSRFAHPDLTRPDKNGRERPVMVAGPVPVFHHGTEPDAMLVPDHVEELVLLADGDSEPVMTASAMVRARTRHSRPGCIIPILWPRAGTDFAAMLAGDNSAFDTAGGRKPAKWGQEGAPGEARPAGAPAAREAEKHEAAE